MPPADIPILDTATIFMTFKGPTHPSLADTLRKLGYNASHSAAPFHNAANDAWYTLELLFLEAEQALKQIKSPDGEDTIDWLAPPKALPSSPSRDTSSKGDYDRSLSIPTLEKKSKNSTHFSSPYHSQTPHTPPDGRAQPTLRRRQNRKRARSERAEVDDSTAVAALADTCPPTKRRKVTHDKEAIEKAGEGAHRGGAIELNGSSRDSGLASEAEVGGQRDRENKKDEEAEEKEEPEEGPMIVTSGASEACTEGTGLARA